MRLTETNIPKNLPPKGQKELVDDLVPGLLLRGNKNAASWTLRFTHEGIRQRHTLGKWPAVTLADARRAAQRVFGELALGHAPTRAANQLSLADALAKAEAQGFAHLKNPKHYFGTMRLHLSHLLARDVRSITKAELLSAADELRPKKAATADVLLRVAKPVWRWMSERDLCEDVLAGVRVAQTRIRDDYLSLEQTRKVYAVLQEMPYPYGPAFTVLLLTAGRRNEVLSMRKQELDLENALWEIPGDRNKNGLPWRIPLGDRAVEVLQDALELAPEGPWVFSTTGKAPSKGIDKALARVRREAELPDFRLHDLRRTVVTHLADLGYDPSSVDRLLNHVAASTSSRVARIYNKSDLLPVRRKMVEDWERLVLER